MNVPELEPHHQMQFSVISRTLVVGRVLLNYCGAVGVYYRLHPADYFPKRHLEFVLRFLQLLERNRSVSPIYIKWRNGSVSLLGGISTLVGYLMPKLSL